jgi:hypothetical protein
MPFIIGLSVLWFSCSSMALPGASDSLNAGERPFVDTEPIDMDLLRSQLNLALGDALRDLDMNLVYDARIARAADAMLRHPEYEDSTDENGWLIPFDRMLVEKEGRPCNFVYNVHVSSKTVCPTVRRFDDSDTYAAVAARYVDQALEGTADLIQKSGFTGYGVGALLKEEYPEMEDGRVLTDEPKDEWIYTLFFLTL